MQTLQIQFISIAKDEKAGVLCALNAAVDDSKEYLGKKAWRFN